MVKVDNEDNSKTRNTTTLHFVCFGRRMLEDFKYELFPSFNTYHGMAYHGMTVLKANTIIWMFHVLIFVLDYW